MKRIIVAVQFIALMFLLISGVVFADTQLPKAFDFGSKLYKIEIYRPGLWTLYSGDKVLGMVWPWPFCVDDRIWGTPDTAEEITGIEEEKGDDIIFKINGSTTSYLYDYEIVCSDTELKATYNFEAKKKIGLCVFNLFISDKYVENLEYEWGTTEGVPEAKGVISAEKPLIEGVPAYFKFYNMNDRDVTFTFNEGTPEIKAEHWQLYGKNEKNTGVLNFSVYPTNMEKGITIKKGTKGKVAFTISFEKTGKKTDKKK